MRIFFTRRPGPISFIILGSTIIILLILIPLTAVFTVSNTAAYTTVQRGQNAHMQPTSNTGTIRANVTPQTNSSPTASITSSPTPTPTPGVSSLQFSFEDGSVDNWQLAGPVLLQNSTEHAENGSHALKASFTALAASNYPYISIAGGNIPNPYPKVNQTLKAYIYVPVGSPSTSVWWFVADSKNAWHKGIQQSLTQGAWNLVTFAMPNINSQPSQMGLQFATNNGGTAYIDAISWS